MPVFRVFRTGNEIQWSLHGGSVGSPGEAIARSPVSFTTAQAAKDAIAGVRTAARDAAIDDETAVEVVTGSSVRVGKPKVVSKRVPATPLASPSSIVTEDDDNGATGAPGGTPAARAPRGARLEPRPSRAAKPAASGP